MLNRTFLFVLIFLLTPTFGYSATKVWEYGFEDWSGDCSTSSGYPFYLCGVNDAVTSLDKHDEGTEVISSCSSNDADNWQPHSGSYFFYSQVEEDLSSDTCLAVGDDPQSINTWNRINLSTFSAATTDEITVHFYFRFAGQANTLAGGQSLKFLDLETNGTYNTSKDMEVWSHFGTGGVMYFVDERAVAWGDSVSWPGSVNPLTDGEWHSYAIYAKLSTGELKIWMDTVDWDEPTVSRTGYQWYDAEDDVPATQFEFLYIHENYSTSYPDGSLQFALDDISVWDGIPDDGGSMQSGTGSIQAGTGFFQ